MKIIHSVHPEDFRSYTTEIIRERFLVDQLVQPDQIQCTYTHYDRMIIGIAAPTGARLVLPNYPNLRASFFLERREIGIINISEGAGQVIVEEQVHVLQKFDCLYIGRGEPSVSFASTDPDKPAIFFFLSSPAHTNYPTRLMTIEEAVKVVAGAAETANLRTINKYIHLEGIKSCQLVMGLTVLHQGSVWNTMPPHTHDRRMEAYFYFDLLQDQQVVHFMGEGQQTRHIMVHNHEAVVSPPWSIHSGCGTASYSFIWGMAGENLDYTDMDAITVTDLR